MSSAVPTPSLAEVLSLNGARVVQRGNTLFIPLPPAMWRVSFEGIPCRCPTCERRGSTVAYWDTLAVAPGHRHAWTVHAPDLHPEPVGSAD